MKLWDRFRNWLKPPVFVGDEDKTRVASVLNIVLLILLGFVFFNGPIATVQTQNLPVVTFILFISILGMSYL